MYQALYRKYRPKTFSDMTEQSVICEILENISNQDEIDCRNFLFIGSQGVGKTTCARALALKLNNGNGEPIELDAASHGGVDDIRQLVQQMKTYPVNCRWKVFIIDECHALSPQSWQSLLLVLESNPARSIVCLCTTNPEKIPATILSRVQVFQLSKISTKGIHDRLVHVIECENKEGRNISFDDDAIEYIAKLASGGMRDALTLLDKALCFSTNITLENISKSLNIPNYSDFFEIIR